VRDGSGPIQENKNDNDEAGEDEDESGRSLQQVSIYMQQFDWLTRDDDGL